MRENEFSDQLRKDALRWCVLIDNDMLTADERLEFEIWIGKDPKHAVALERASTLMSAFSKLDDRKVATHYSKLSPLDRLRSALFGRRWRKLDLRTGFIAATSATASLCLALVIINHIGGRESSLIVPEPVEAVYQTNTAELKTVELSDLSIVTLGPESVIEVTISESMRSVNLLKGAAVFDVTHDPARPFIVSADLFSARVLGTVFDVRNNGGVVRMSVAEGRVEASLPMMIGDQPTTLVTRRTVLSGEALIASREANLSRPSAFRAETFAAWRSNRLTYNGAPLTEIVADANRYSLVPILLELPAQDTDQLKATFTYDTQDLDTMLASLPNLFPVEVDRTDGTKVVIRAKN